MAGRRYRLKALRKFGEDVLQKAGATQQDSGIITDTLLCADLRGIHSHGIGKLDNYIARVAARVLDPVADMAIERENAATAVLNARNGFGQVAGVRAMELAMRKAGDAGIGMVLVRNSNHFGIASYYALMAARRNYIGLIATNASPGIAPFGAREKMLGTNPLAIAVPSRSAFPIVLDMSTSVVARGKVRQAGAAGEKIPLGWARDAQGLPTTDPVAALKGTLEPIAGPKGAGLSLMIELLCGVLSASAMPGEVKVITDTSGPCRTGHTFCAIDPGCFTDSARFLEQVDETIHRVKGLSPVQDAIYLPGELEHLRSEQNSREGIALTETALASLRKLAEQYAVPFFEGEETWCMNSPI